MCGILGIYDPQRRWSEEARSRFDGSLAHRGPDSQGAVTWGDWHLYHHRLSIIDLSDNGRQPMIDEKEEVALVFNGEIYNYQALRAGLEQRGHRFRSRTDTEVILRLYLEQGEEAILSLEGMFALALLDRRQGQLLLARDRFGKKPLYYTEQGGSFVFSSEIKSFYALPGLNLTLSPPALAAYFTLQFIPAPRSIYGQIQKLPPGCLLRRREGKNTLRRYFDPLAQPGRRQPFDSEKLEELLRQAVRKRLMADVPLGLFLSGGLDSSLLLALLSQLGQGPVKTFSISFPQPEYDESPYARQVAKIFGADHHEIAFPTCDEELWRRTLWQLDEPLADAAALPTMILSRFASQEVKVVLSGEGADELFGGYAYYPYEYYLALLRRLPVLKQLFHLVLQQRRSRPALADRQHQKLLFALQSPPALGLTRWRVVHPPSCWPWILSPEIRGAVDPQELLQELLPAAPAGAASLDRSWAMDLCHWLPENLMMKVDKTTMAHGLEARAPYLDWPLFQYLSGLPVARRLGFMGRMKALLKPLALRHLPADIVYRPKHGFMNPLAFWMRGSLCAACAALLPAEDSPLFNAAQIRQLWQSLRAGEDWPAHTLWLYFCFTAWQQEVARRRP